MPENNLIQDLLAVIKGSFPASFKNPPLSEEQLSLIGEKFKPIISQHQSESELITDSREVTILLSDLRGFTSISENFPAPDVMALLNRYLTRMNEIIVTQYGGTIDKFMGDAIMVLFGAPEEKADDLSRALSCAIQMQVAMDEINLINDQLGMPQLFMGIGINTGTVVAGKLGSELHSEYTVIGDEVNLASRIEAYSLRGQILISENTYQKAKDWISTGEANQVLVKGKTQAVNLYELLSIKSPTQIKVPSREVRKSPRVTVNLPLNYYKVVNKSVLDSKNVGLIIDLSYSGMLIESTEKLEAYSDIKFSLALSLVAEQTSDIYGKVIKCDFKQEKWQVSIEFTAISSAAKEAIKNYIHRIIQGV